MSLDTWKQKFYPYPAYQCTDANAILHSLRKWVGLRECNTDAHSVLRKRRQSNQLIDNAGNAFEISADTCALCCVYFSLEREYRERCKTCPLYESLGFECDEDIKGPYGDFITDGNPEPMIRALAKAFKESKKGVDSHPKKT